MVTKRKAPQRARRRAPVRRAAPRRRTAKNGYNMIAPAAATVALVAVNASKLKVLGNAVTNAYRDPIGKWPTRLIQGAMGQNNWVNGALKKFVTADALITDAMAVAGGYVGGEVVRKYAPAMIKKPLGKIAKKIPKVI